jgi:dipeptidyl aminopeptidase/acylaminoacyl peptidase
VDIAAHSAKPFGFPYPSLASSDVGPIRMFDWKAADGLALRGVLSLPPGPPAANLPLVVMPHGGPEARDYPVFDWWAQAFASRGYAVFQPNFRGSSDYGVAFRNAGFGEWGRKMQTDISDGVAELAKQGLVDPKRVCIVGASYGGYAALAGVTLQQGLYRCAVAVAGVSDLGAMTRYVHDRGGDEASSGTRYWSAFMGEHQDDVSPIRLASRADAPILLVHGKDDTVVPFAESEAMAAALRAAGKPVEFVVMQGEDHWLSREDTRVMMLKASVAFVEKYDPPGAAAP